MALYDMMSAESGKFAAIVLYCSFFVGYCHRMCWAVVVVRGGWVVGRGVWSRKRN